jgi:hypothetical protein
MEKFLAEVKKLFRWLLLIAALIGLVYGFVHDASWWQLLLVGLSALCFLLTAVGMGWGSEVYSERLGKTVTVIRDVYFPIGLIMSTIAVAFYLMT